MTFGTRLRQLRKEHGLESKYVAEQLQVARSTYSGYENDKTRPSFELLDDIANFFDVSIDYLLCRTDEKNINNNQTLVAAHATKDLTKEEQEKLIEFAEFLKATRK